MNLERVLDLAMERADQAQVMGSRREGSTVSFESGRLKTASSYQTSSAALRVIVDGKLGAASRSGPFDAQELAHDALAMAEFGSDAPFEWPGPQPAPQVKTVDERVPAITRAQMVEWGQAMIDALREHSPEIVSRASVGARRGTTAMLSSAGLCLDLAGTLHHVGVGGQLTRGTDMLLAGHSAYWRAAELDHLDVVRRAIEKFRWAETNASVASKTMPVIFAPEALHVLLYGLTLGISGKNVLKGDSPLKGKLGRKLFDERLTLTDNPLVDYALDSSPFDGEGTVHRITPIVHQGVLESFLYDLKAAAEAGVQSTGHGPGCGATNLIVSPGDTPYADMVADTQEGVLVHDVMGLGQGNAISGEFSVNLLLAYKIENGQIVGRVKDAMLAGNAYDALSHIDCLSAETEWVHGSLQAPAVKVRGLSVVAQAGN